MEAPPNLGESYTEGFREVFARVASEPGVRMIPFLLDGVAGVPELNQADGIHPTPEGHRRMAETAWPGEDVTPPYPVFIPSNEDNQIAYVERLLLASSQKSRAWTEVAKRYQQFNLSELATRVLGRRFVLPFHDDRGLG